MTKKKNTFNQLSCPGPHNQYSRIVLAHGGGGRLSRQLLEEKIRPCFSNPQLDNMHDGSSIHAQYPRLVMTTDSHVISPLFFPGGDIGTLSVYGTVNDLAMCGAMPLALSLAFIIEEGLPMQTFEKILHSIQAAAGQIPVDIITGDTKVVEQGNGDQIYINTTGIGQKIPGSQISWQKIAPGDAVIINGAIAEHGMAILSQRQGLEFESDLCSDCAPVHGLVQKLLEKQGESIHMLRDPTRGGVASILNEIAAQCQWQIEIDEALIPVSEPVKGACELMGFDPLYVANEGKLLCFAAPEAAEESVSILRQLPGGEQACIIGKVTDQAKPQVILKSKIGGKRLLSLLSGEQLPRIC